MSRISAKAKLTLWTSLLITLMACIVFFFIFAFSENIIERNAEDSLLEVVNDNAKEIDFENGRIELDLEDIDLYKNNIYTLLYDENYELLAGNIPENLGQYNSSINEIPFTNGELKEHTLGETTLYIYDVLVSSKAVDDTVWVRGIISIDEAQNATNIIFFLAIASLPLFIIIATLGCYFIAKKTFRPIDRIIQTAESITQSGNLSLRINITKSDAEMQKLSDTFDNMFERLQWAFANLEKTYESERQFTSDVSHELRTPTSVILAQCEYALDTTATPADKEEALETVQRQALKMSKLISDLLNIIRLERGMEKAIFKPHNLSDIVHNICEEQKIIAPSKIKIHTDIHPSITGDFDEVMITRLLNNLISNAFRFTNENGNVLVSLSENAHNIILSVKDDGIGISPENLPKIWSKFYQVDSSRTATKDGNMGLGLSMVSQIAQFHNAKIEVYSELNQGSEFVVKFSK